MKNISPYRIIGRANAARHYLLEKYQLATSDPSADTILVLLALEQRVYLQDQFMCRNIAGAAQLCRSQIANLRLSDSEGRKEIIAGEKEGLYIFRKYRSDYAARIIDDKDFIPEIQADEAAKKRRKKRNMRIALGALGAFVLAIIIYNLPYFAENRAFGEVKKTIDEGYCYTYDTAVEHYYYQYPEGRHVEEVHFLPIRSCRKFGQPIYAVKAAEKYLNRFPDGKYADEVTGIYNDIWNDEISRFNEQAADKATAKGAEFVRNMLEYMKEKRVSTIAVTGNPTLNLKEYAEYPEIIRHALEQNANENSDIKLPDDMVTIKDKISERLALSWTDIIAQALQNGFNRVLTENFITFVNKNEAAPASPEVIVDYTVSTQETGQGSYACPDIWVHTSKLNNLTMSRSFILGIGMTFDAHFTLPDSNITYNIQGNGDAGSEDIQASPDVAYNIMCERCTERFSEKIAAQFGI